MPAERRQPRAGDAQPTGRRGGQLARLGISMVAVDERAKNIEQLKKLEHFLAKQEGVSVAGGGEHAHDHGDHKARHSSEVVVRTSSTYKRVRRESVVAVAAMNARSRCLASAPNAAASQSASSITDHLSQSDCSLTLHF